MALFLLRLIVTAVAFAAAAFLIPGIDIRGGLTYVIVALLFGLVNAIIRPLALLVTCLLNFFTLGLFVLVVNAAMLLLTAWLTGVLAGAGLDVYFQVQDFPSALLGAIIISVVSFVLSKFLGANEE